MFPQIEPPPSRPNRWWVYVVQCNDDSLYTGITTSVKRRVGQHNTGACGAKYTRSRRPVRLVWHFRVRYQNVALKVEAWIKSLPRESKEQLIQGDVTLTQQLYDCVRNAKRRFQTVCD